MVHKVSSPLTAVINTSTNLYCVATGFPHPAISWLKDGVNISLSHTIQASTLSATDVMGQSTISLPNGVSVPLDSTLSELLSHDEIPLLGELGSIGLLVYNGVVRDDTANYTCVASNSLPPTGTLSDQSISTNLIVQGIVIQILSHTHTRTFMYCYPCFTTHRTTQPAFCCDCCQQH